MTQSAYPSVDEIQGDLSNEIASILSANPADIDVRKPLHSMGIDSMSFIELLVFVERRFKLKLIETGLKPDDFKSVASLAACILRELQGTNGA